ncbi:MAG: hypothetical protein ABW000_15755 [Actinoplanes sp.]
MKQIAGHPYWELTFDKAGTLNSPAQGSFLDDVAGQQITNLFVFSHGWGTGEQHARTFYARMFPLIATAAAEAGLGGIGFAGVFWPSLWFPDPPAEAAAHVSEQVQADRPGAADTVLTGKEIAQTLQASFAVAQHAAIERLGTLIDEGTAGVNVEPDTVQQQRLDEFHALVGDLFSTGRQPAEDAGEESLLFARDPKAAYAKISDIVGSAPAGGSAQGLGDFFGKVWHGAKDTLRVGSYFEMKGRAGDVGRNGLGPLLEHLHQRVPANRVHLAGHSFGARLVSFALKGISSPAASPVASLSLIQAAFSHYSFSRLQDMPFGSAGALNGFADRVHGPLTSTFTPHDWAVGRWYPKASFLAREDAQAKDVPPVTRWGGLGADGFQAVAPAHALDLLPHGSPYPLAAGVYYRVDATGTIADTGQSSFSGAHSDIEHPEVAWLIAAAAAAA